MSERRKSWGAPIAVIVLLLLLPAAYMGSYLAMVDYFDPLSLLGSDVEGLVYVGPPSYHYGGEAAESFFYPAYFIDSRVVRPDNWVEFEYEWIEVH